MVTPSYICAMELFLRHGHVLRHELHPSRLEARLVGNRRQDLRFPGNLRDAPLPPRTVRYPHLLRHPTGLLVVPLRRNHHHVCSECPDIQLRKSRTFLNLFVCCESVPLSNTVTEVSNRSTCVPVSRPSRSKPCSITTPSSGFWAS